MTSFGETALLRLRAFSGSTRPVCGRPAPARLYGLDLELMWYIIASEGCRLVAKVFLQLDPDLVANNELVLSDHQRVLDECVIDPLGDARDWFLWRR